jgi:hypothetical protein
MNNETVAVPLRHLLAGASLVPEAQRTAFLATLLVGADALATLTKESKAPPTPIGDDDDDGPHSFPLNAQQARKLKEKLDPATWAVIRTAVGKVTGGVAMVDWGEVKSVTGVPNWTAFAKGRLGGLNRALRKIDAVPSDAILLWYDDDDWVEDGQGDYSAGTLRIDGPAVHVLRLVMGIASTGN